ncbi:MAG: hypothetical protein KIT09_26615 [Bryobacteraceae bacterium]|nr:hypothetical protein [Bryobacteraceae bacterium]
MSLTSILPGAPATCRLIRILAAALSLQAAVAASEIDRLVTLGKLWFNIQYFHPSLAHRTDVDWDQALVRAIPKVRAAKTGDDYAAAVQSMLEELGDPMTRVVRPRAQESASEDDRWFRIGRRDGLLILTLVPLGSDKYSLLRQEIPSIEKEIRAENAVIFDLRSESGMESDCRFVAGALSEEAGFWKLLIDRPVRQPGVRYRTHDAYQTGMEYSEARLEQPEAAGLRRQAVFLVNRYSALPPMAAALEVSGQAVVIFAGDGNPVPPGSAKAIRLEGEWRAEYRADEIILEDGSGPPAPSLRVSEAEALKTAVEQARSPGDFEATAPRLPLLPVPRSPSYAGLGAFPAPETRLLAAFRTWGIVHYFFAYKRLLESDWEQTLRSFIPRLLDARNALEYHLALAEMVTHLQDSHARVASPVIGDHFGTASPPIQLQMIEGKPVVARIIETLPDVSVGDVVTEVDGEAAAARFDRLSRFVSSSTPQAARASIMRHFLNGPEGSTARMKLEGPAGVREAQVERSHSFLSRLAKRRDGEVVRMLTGNIGYVDLDRLEVEDVDSMFERLRNTKAIVFDMRGYPNGTAWSIAPRLTPETNVTAAVFRRRIWFEPDGFDLGELNGEMTYTFFQRLPETAKWRYSGKVVMLIDESAYSQAEHTCLFFEAAASATFVGSPTAGVNGDVAFFPVPGGARIYYTGHDVRHADGRQLQRVGIQPHVHVAPTIAGIRAGRDEVLDRALEYLAWGK